MDGLQGHGVSRLHPGHGHCFSTSAVRGILRTTSLSGPHINCFVRAACLKSTRPVPIAIPMDTRITGRGVLPVLIIAVIVIIIVVGITEVARLQSADVSQTSRGSCARLKIAILALAGISLGQRLLPWC